MSDQNVHMRIHAVMKEVKTVLKTENIGYGNSQYKAVSHDAVTRLLHEPVVNAGLIAIPNMESCEVTSYEAFKKDGNKYVNFQATVIASVVFYNIHKPEEFIKTECTAYAFDVGDKAVGKAYSMALKYCYLKTFMLESLDGEEKREDYSQEFDRIQPNQTKRTPMISEKQAEYLESLLVKSGKTPTGQTKAWINGLNIQQAKDQIEKLKNESGAK